MTESRKPQTAKSKPLPLDYLKLVNEVFSANFEAGLKAFSKLKETSARFETSGHIYPDEIVLSVSLLSEGQISSTTVHASSDFDPKAESPTIQDLLSACVDAAGMLYFQFLTPDQPEKLAQMADESLSALENVPFEWTPLQVDRHTIYLRIDKSNPRLDQLTDEWLEKNDPDHQKRIAEEQEAMENLFVTGPRKKKLH